MTSAFDQLATQCHGNWRALLRTRANCIVTASAPLLDEFCAASRRVLRAPIACLSARTLRDPGRARTVVLTDVHLTTPIEQRALVSWIDDPQCIDTQAIVLTPVSLFTLVEAGAFDAHLFYRLNTIHLDLLQASTPR